MEQYGHGCEYEIFTIDGLFDDMIDGWKTYVKEANEKNRTFTYADFKNGKVIMPEMSPKLIA